MSRLVDVKLRPDLVAAFNRDGTTLPTAGVSASFSVEGADHVVRQHLIDIPIDKFLVLKQGKRQSPWVETGAFPWRVEGGKFCLRFTMGRAFCPCGSPLFCPCGLPLFQLRDFALYAFMLHLYQLPWLYMQKWRRFFTSWTPCQNSELRTIATKDEEKRLLRFKLWFQRGFYRLFLWRDNCKWLVVILLLMTGLTICWQIFCIFFNVFCRHAQFHTHYHTL